MGLYVLLSLSSSFYLAKPVDAADRISPASAPSAADEVHPVHGGFSEARPGGDADKPGSYPFLPSDAMLPPVGARIRVKHTVGINLAAHLPYRVSANTPDEYWRQEEAQYADTGQLTDGRLAPLDFANAGWAGYHYQYTRQITLDLRHPVYVQSTSIDCLQNLGAGIVFPDEVRYYGSQDGKHYFLLGRVRKPHPVYGRSADFKPETFSFELENIRHNARFIRAEFTNKVWTFADEFSVYGWPLWVSRGAGRTPPADVRRVSSKAPGYAMANRRGGLGVHNILLVYTHGHGALGTWRERDFEPVVERSRSGRRGPLFDAVLFTPYRLTTSRNDWIEWMNALFADGAGLHALDEAMSHHARSLWWFGQPQERIILMIPSISPVPSFVLDSGKVSLDPNRVDSVTMRTNQRRVVDWYVQSLEKRWQNAHFRHLQWVGVGWQPESLSVIQDGDASFVQSVSRFVHHHGLGFVWIPFYGAVGAGDWKSLGFDLAVLQPNVSFQWNASPTARFASATRFAKAHGMGIEIEAHWDVTSSHLALAKRAQALYLSYFHAGRVMGFDNPRVVRAWYLNSKTLLTSYRSQNPLYRRIYDSTVAFIERRTPLDSH